MNKLLVLLFSAFLIFNLNVLIASAQQAESIDIVSLKIRHNYLIDSEAKITYRNSANSLVTIYGSIGNLVPYNALNPFGMSLNTLPYINVGNVNTSPTVEFRFILTSMESESIILRPTISRRKRYFSLSGATALRGRLEVFDRDSRVYRVIAVDDDFKLEGRYKAGFFQNFGERRTAKFDSLEYELSQNP